MESIITIATVLTMYFNAANDVNAPYLYNADMENGVINKVEVYEKKADNQMAAKMEYRYAYDEQGRLTSKETLNWDEARKDYVAASRLTYKYYAHGYNVEMSYYDAKSGCYDVPTEVTLYREVAPMVTSVRTYKMNEQKDDMYLSNKMLVMGGGDDYLLATK